MIGKKLSPIFVEIEDLILEFEVNTDHPPQYTDEAFMAITKIFMSGIMDKMWALQQAENIDFESRVSMAEQVGTQLHQLIKTYTGIDTREYYKQ